MDQYKQYLAANVLSEGQIVNYRLLSRALKVHSTIAKQMLFDFHKAQNVKKLQSVHATYLVTGKKKLSVTTNGSSTKESEDISMRSSSPPFSSFPRSESIHEPEQIAVTTVTLVKEEALEAVQSEYEEIHSIFIYSLEPGPIQDLQLLSECNRKVTAEYASEDPLSAWKRYGVVQNPNAKRRTSRQPSAAAAQSSTSTISTSKSAAPKKEEAKSSLSSVKPKSSTEPSKKTESTPSLTRRESSNISSMFANAKAKPKPKPTDSSAAPTNNVGTTAEDSPMKDVSDDEVGEDDDFVMVDDGKAEVAKLARKEREDKLRAMMDDDGDEAMSDANPTARPEPADEMDQEAEVEADVDDGAALDARPKATDDDKREEAHVEGGRRRGKRKVMKKKTTKDEDGFLVTTEEAVWESFSEDEPDPKKAKAQPSSFGKGTKKSAKQGQGSIMNFFKKG